MMPCTSMILAGAGLDSGMKISGRAIFSQACRSVPDRLSDALHRAFVDLRLDEQLQQLGVEVPRAGVLVEDGEAAMERNGGLVGPVLGRQRVEDIGDGHGLALHRD